MVEKITRATFIYFPPRVPEIAEDNAQCGACRVWVPQHAMPTIPGPRCVLHGSKMDADDDDSCGLMIPWPTPDGQPVAQVVKDHARELMKGIPGSVTPEQSGFVKRRVQCHRCYWGRQSNTRCGLYELLNKLQPMVFDLDTKIEPHACCNAQTPRGKPETEIARWHHGLGDNDAERDEAAAKQGPAFGRIGGY